LFLIVGIGFSYSKFFLESKIERLESELANKQNDFNSKQSINSQFTDLNERYEVALEVIANYDKVLYPNNKPDDVYDFLNQVNEEGGNGIFFDYIYSDSLPNNEYGIIQSQIAGFGSYRSLTDFVNRIEHSQLLNKVTGLTISPARQESDLNTVNFSFDLESYYEKTSIFDSTGSEFRVILAENISTYNPLYPLIRTSIPANTDNLTNVRSSRMIGITENRVFLRNQNNRILSLKQGDRVYLGYLSSINLENKTATFTLNVGGIQEVVTLEVIR
jgi:hypothetical protein